MTDYLHRALDRAYDRGDAYMDAYHALGVVVRTPGLTDADREAKADEIHTRLRAAREAARTAIPGESRGATDETREA